MNPLPQPPSGNVPARATESSEGRENNSSLTNNVVDGVAKLHRYSTGSNSNNNISTTSNKLPTNPKAIPTVPKSTATMEQPSRATPPADGKRLIRTIRPIDVRKLQQSGLDRKIAEALSKQKQQTKLNKSSVMGTKVATTAKGSSINATVPSRHIKFMKPVATFSSPTPGTTTQPTFVLNPTSSFKPLPTSPATPQPKSVAVVVTSASSPPPSAASAPSKPITKKIIIPPKITITGPEASTECDRPEMKDLSPEQRMKHVKSLLHRKLLQRQTSSPAAEDRPKLFEHLKPPSNESEKARPTKSKRNIQILKIPDNTSLQIETQPPLADVGMAANDNAMAHVLPKVATKPKASNTQETSYNKHWEHLSVLRKDQVNQTALGASSNIEKQYSQTAPVYVRSFNQQPTQRGQEISYSKPCEPLYNAPLITYANAEKQLPKMSPVFVRNSSFQPIQRPQEVLYNKQWGPTYNVPITTSTSSNQNIKQFSQTPPVVVRSSHQQGQTKYYGSLLYSMPKLPVKTATTTYANSTVTQLSQSPPINVRNAELFGETTPTNKLPTKPKTPQKSPQDIARKLDFQSDEPAKVPHNECTSSEYLPTHVVHDIVYGKDPSFMNEIPKASIKPVYMPPSICQDSLARQRIVIPDVSPLKTPFPSVNIPQEAPLPTIDTFKKPYPLPGANYYHILPQTTSTATIIGPNTGYITTNYHIQQSAAATSHHLTNARPQNDYNVTSVVNINTPTSSNSLIVLENKVLSQDEMIDLTALRLSTSKIDTPQRFARPHKPIPEVVIKQEKPDDFPTSSFAENIPEKPVVSQKVIEENVNAPQSPIKGLVFISSKQNKKFIVNASKLKLPPEKIAELAKKISESATGQLATTEKKNSAAVQGKDMLPNHSMPSENKEQSLKRPQTVNLMTHTQRSRKTSEKEHNDTERSALEDDAVISKSTVQCLPSPQSMHDEIISDKIEKIQQNSPHMLINSVANMTQKEKMPQRYGQKFFLIVKQDPTDLTKVVPKPEISPIAKHTSSSPHGGLNRVKQMQVESLLNKTAGELHTFQCSPIKNRKSAVEIIDEPEPEENSFSAVDFIASLASNHPITEETQLELSPEELNLNASCAMNFSPLRIPFSPRKIKVSTPDQRRQIYSPAASVSESCNENAVEIGNIVTLREDNNVVNIDPQNVSLSTENVDTIVIESSRGRDHVLRKSVESKMPVNDVTAGTVKPVEIVNVSDSYKMGLQKTKDFKIKKASIQPKEQLEAVETSKERMSKTAKTNVDSEIEPIKSTSPSNVISLCEKQAKETSEAALRERQTSSKKDSHENMLTKMPAKSSSEQDKVEISEVSATAQETLSRKDFHKNISSEMPTESPSEQDQVESVKVVVAKALQKLSTKTETEHGEPSSTNPVKSLTLQNSSPDTMEKSMKVAKEKVDASITILPDELSGQCTPLTEPLKQMEEHTAEITMSTKSQPTVQDFSAKRATQIPADNAGSLKSILKTNSSDDANEKYFEETVKTPKESSEADDISEAKSTEDMMDKAKVGELNSSMPVPSKRISRFKKGKINLVQRNKPSTANSKSTPKTKTLDTKDSATSLESSDEQPKSVETISILSAKSSGQNEIQGARVKESTNDLQISGKVVEQPISEISSEINVIPQTSLENKESECKISDNVLPQLLANQIDQLPKASLSIADVSELNQSNLKLTNDSPSICDAKVIVIDNNESVSEDVDKSTESTNLPETIDDTSNEISILKPLKTNTDDTDEMSILRHNVENAPVSNASCSKVETDENAILISSHNAENAPVLNASCSKKPTDKGEKSILRHSTKDAPVLNSSSSKEATDKDEKSTLSHSAKNAPVLNSSCSNEATERDVKSNLSHSADDAPVSNAAHKHIEIDTSQKNISQLLHPPKIAKHKSNIRISQDIPQEAPSPALKDMKQVTVSLVDIVKNPPSKVPAKPPKVPFKPKNEEISKKLDAIMGIRNLLAKIRKPTEEDGKESECSKVIDKNSSTFVEQKGEIVSQKKGEILSQNQDVIVSQKEDVIVLHKESEIVSQKEGEMVSQELPTVMALGSETVPTAERHDLNASAQNEPQTVEQNTKKEQKLGCKDIKLNKDSDQEVTNSNVESTNRTNRDSKTSKVTEELATANKDGHSELETTTTKVVEKDTKKEQKLGRKNDKQNNDRDQEVISSKVETNRESKTSTVTNELAIASKDGLSELEVTSSKVESSNRTHWESTTSKTAKDLAKVSKDEDIDLEVTSSITESSNKAPRQSKTSKISKEIAIESKGGDSYLEVTNLKVESLNKTPRESKTAMTTKEVAIASKDEDTDDQSNRLFKSEGDLKSLDDLDRPTTEAEKSPSKHDFICAYAKQPNIPSPIRSRRSTRLGLGSAIEAKASIGSNADISTEVKDIKPSKKQRKSLTDQNANEKEEHSTKKDKENRRASKKAKNSPRSSDTEERHTLFDKVKSAELAETSNVSPRCVEDLKTCSDAAAVPTKKTRISSKSSAVENLTQQVTAKSTSLDVHVVASAKSTTLPFNIIEVEDSCQDSTQDFKNTAALNQRKRLRKTLEDIKKSHKQDTDSEDERDFDSTSACQDPTDFLGFDDQSLSSAKTPNPDGNAEDEKSSPSAAATKGGTLKNWLTTGKAISPTSTKEGVFKRLRHAKKSSAMRGIPLKKRWDAEAKAQEETDITDDTSPADDEVDDGCTRVKRSKRYLKTVIDSNKDVNNTKRLKLTEGDDNLKHTFVEPKPVEPITKASETDSDTPAFSGRRLKRTRRRLISDDFDGKEDNKKTLELGTNLSRESTNFKPIDVVEISDSCGKLTSIVLNNSDEPSINQTSSKDNDSIVSNKPTNVTNDTLNLSIEEKSAEKASVLDLKKSSSKSLKNKNLPRNSLHRKVEQLEHPTIKDDDGEKQTPNTKLKAAPRAPLKRKFKVEASNEGDCKKEVHTIDDKVEELSPKPKRAYKKKVKAEDLEKVETRADIKEDVDKIENKRAIRKSTNVEATSNSRLQLQKKPKIEDTNDFNKNLDTNIPEGFTTQTPPSANVSPFLGRGKYMRRPTPENQFNPRLLLITKREQLETDEILTETIPGSGPIQCGLCLKRTNLAKWEIHLAEHYGVGWKCGEEALNIQYRPAVLNIISTYLKDAEIKGLQCRMCNKLYRSGLGLLLHIEGCGAGKQRVNCEYCHKNYSALTLPIHLRSCAERTTKSLQTQETQEIKVEVLSATGRAKRHSTIKAESKLKEMGAELVQTIEESSDFNPKDHIRYNAPLEDDVRQKWSADIAKFSKGFCPKKTCAYASDKIAELEEHIKKCKFLMKPGYYCTYCKKRCFETEKLAIAHVNTLHRNGKDFSGSDSDCNIKTDDEQSSNDDDDLSEGVDEVEADENELRNSSKSSSSKKIVNIPKKTTPAKPNVSSAVQMRKRIFPRRRRETTNKFVLQKWKSFLKANYSTDTLFDNFKCQYSVLKTQQYIKYLPNQEMSMKFTTKKKAKLPSVLGEPEDNIEWKQLERYKVINHETDAFLFVGAPVTCCSWLPLPAHVNEQFLLVAYRKDMFKFVKFMNPKPFKTSLMLFKVTQDSENKSIHIEVHYAIAIEDGPVYSVSFLPSGGYNRQDNRLGLVAVASVESTVKVYALPIELPKDCGERSENIPFVEIKPSFALNHDVMPQDNSTGGHILMNPQCLQISWSEFSGHNHIFASFSNGFIGIWDITNDAQENLNRFEVENVINYAPINYFFTGEKGIKHFALHYDTTGPRWIAVANFYRKFVIYDIRNFMQPIPLKDDLARNVIRCLDWCPLWEPVLIGYCDSIPNNGRCVQCINPANIMFHQQKLDNMNSAVTALQYTPYTNTCVASVDNGDVMFLDCREFHYEQPMGRKFGERRVLSCMDIKRLDKKPIERPTLSTGKEKEIQKLESGWTMYESDYKEKYGLVFNPLMKLNDSSKNTFFSVNRRAPLNITPFMRINTLRCNLNKTAKRLVAVGYENGFIRVIYFDKESQFRKR